MTRPKASPWPFVGMGGLACLLFLDAASVTLVPWGVVVVLVALWVVLFVCACRWFVPHPRRVLWTTVVGFAGWLVIVVAGGVVFDW